MADGENLITTASAVGDRSLLLEGLADSFRNILRLELDRDAVKEYVCVCIHGIYIYIYIYIYIFSVKLICDYK